MAKKRPNKPLSLADQILREVEERELTGYRLAKLSGVGQPVIARFLNGSRSVSLETASKICEALDLELRSRRG